LTSRVPDQRWILIAGRDGNQVESGRAVRRARWPGSDDDRRSDRQVLFGWGRRSRRTLDDILAASDRELEAAHDCIQWLFPTSGRSRFNPGTPLVTGDTAGAFESRPELRDRLRRALDRMLAFYGLRRKPAGEAGSEIVIDDARFADPRWAGIARGPRCRTCA
jgi:hypothetical protein